MSDIKANLIELSGPLGLNLASEDTRIKHTKTGELNISSNGTINIEPTVKLGVTTNEIDIISDTINITANFFAINSEVISIKTKDISAPISVDYDVDGNDIEIICGTSSSGQEAGRITLTAGFSQDTDGGDIYINGGYSFDNKGGDINLDVGNGEVKPGSVFVNLGTNSNETKECGRLQMYNGPLTLFVYETETVRERKIKNPVKGDMCLVETSTAGNNLIHYWNGEAWKALQTIN